MSEYHDPSFEERWPLLSKMLRTVAKVMGVAGVIIALVGLATQFLLGGSPQTTITHTNGLTTTTMVQNDFFYSLNFLFPLGILTGLTGLLLWVYAHPVTDRTHLNSETEVEE